MENRPDPKRAARLLWPLLLGLGLMALLALALAPRSAVEARVAKPSFAVEPGAYEPIGSEDGNDRSDAVVAAIRLAQAFTEPCIRLARNPLYYDAASVVITQVTALFLSQDEAWVRYQSGELDSIVPPLSALDEIKASPVYGPQLHTYPGSSINSYNFSQDVPPFDDPLVRAAFASAIDRPRLINETTSKEELPALTFTPPGAFGHVDGYATGIGRPYSPTLAAQLLADSSYTGAPTITLMFNASPDHQAVAEAVRQMWLDVLGVDVTLREMEWNRYLDLLFNGSADERPGVFRLGWTGGYPDANSYLNIFRSGNLFASIIHYNSSEYDALVEAAAIETDPALRLSLYEQAEAILVMSDTAIAPLYYGVNHSLARPDVLRTYRSFGLQHLDEWSFTGTPRPLEIAGEQVPSRLDPAFGDWNSLNEQLFLGLTDIDETGNVVPELATGWEVSPDGRVFTFTLRVDAYWTDGHPVTAYDVEYGVLRTLDPATGSGAAGDLYLIENALAYIEGSITDPSLVGVDALDATHVRFTLSEPAVYFPLIVSLPQARPQPQWAIEAHGDAWTDPENIVTNGPYKLVDWIQTPHLRVEKEAVYGSPGQSPGEGGNLRFEIEYWNDGAAPAENVVITDTMLGGMTYLTDTSGYPHTGSGSGPIVWDLGTLPPFSSGEFQVVVHITAVASETVTNTAQIATANPYDGGDPGEKESTWSEHVVTNNTHLVVEKYARTYDPAPGYDFIWEVKVHNDGNTGSTEVILTETLPISTTLVEWWGEQPGWSQVSSSGDQIVFFNPSVSASQWNRVYLRLHLDANAWSGMQITNTAAITAANDLEANDNFATDNVWVKEPYVNLYVDKGWNSGPLVPDGELWYDMGYGNDGNIPVDNVRITFTLPVSTSYVELMPNRFAGLYSGLITPTEITDDYVVFDIGTLENGAEDWPTMVIRVDPDAPPGTTLTATFEINPDPNEYHYDDNTVTWVHTLNEAGPNLEIVKSHEWNGEDRIDYQIFVRNRGTTPLAPVWITDTYPISTTWNGHWDSWCGPSPWFTATHDAANNRLVFRMEDDPFDWQWACVNFQVDLDGGIVGTQGLAFTNNVDAPYPGDIDPTNNTAQDVAYAGPDLYVEKWISDGQPWPGETVTFTVKLGNQSSWDGLDGAYGSYITDTLPPEMTFITATAPWDPNQSWYPARISDNTLGWDWGVLRHWNTFYFDIVAQITDTVSYGDLFTNIIEVYSDNPADMEPDWDNNVFALPITVLTPHFEVDKVFESSRVAGTVVTYTLTADYISDFDATNVVLSDTLPAGLVYGGSDGAFDGTDITWPFASVAPGGRVSAWFSATLPCTAGLPVINDAYRVVASTQGVTSTFGLPVSFDVLAPTIDVDLAYAPETVLLNETVHFTAAASTDGTPMSFEWSFGDGTTGIGLTSIHTYTVDGDYTVVFTATDACGYTAVQATAVTVYRPADLSLTKTDEPDPVPAGTSLTYVLTVSNHGPWTATGVVLTDTLPSGVSFLSASPAPPTCIESIGVVTCDLGNLDTDATATVTILATPNFPGTLVNYAIVAAAEFDPDPSNDADSIDTTVAAAPAPYLSKAIPNSGANDQPTDVTIYGAYFQPGATASLDGIPLQAVTFIDVSHLQATVPSGLEPGTYDLTVVNPDAASGVLFDAFTVLDVTPPTILDVVPAQGPTDTPVTVDIYGLNFAPGFSATLSITDTQVPLEGLIFINASHLRAVVPIDLTPGTYDLTVTNPDALSHTLSPAYEAVEPLLLDDLHASSLDFWLDPTSLRQGQDSPRMGLMVRRQGGQQPLIASVEVDFFEGSPSGTFLGRGIVAALPPDGRASTVAIAWPSPAAGSYVLYAVIDPTDAIAETNEDNNVVSRTVTVQPPLPDTTPPLVDSFSINDGAANTTDRQVHLDTTAHDLDGSGLAHLIFIEYEFIQSVGDWVPVAIGDWLPYEAANSDYLWALQPSPGVHYLQVWVTDDAGNISLDPGSGFINLLPTQLSPAHVTRGQVHIYRQYLTAGQSLHIRLTSVLPGDADLYAWAPDSSLVAYSWTPEPEEGVEFTAHMDGVYQIEVEGYTSADYWLEIAPGTGLQMSGAIYPAARGRFQPFCSPADTPTDDDDVTGVPSPPMSHRLIYLPIILRQG